MSEQLPCGSYDSTIDDKGRILIPSPLRDCYKGTLVVTQGNLRCVWIYLPEKWKKYRENIEHGFMEKMIDYRQYELLKQVHVHPKREVDIDPKSGRISVAAAVRTYAGLNNKKCMVISTENRLEIWDAQNYYDYLNENWDRIQEASNIIGTVYSNSEGKEGTA